MLFSAAWVRAVSTLVSVWARPIAHGSIETEPPLPPPPFFAMPPPPHGEPPALFGQHAVDRGMIGRQSVPEQSLLGEPEPFEEPARVLMARAGHRPYPPAAKLAKRVGEDRRQISAAAP